MALSFGASDLEGLLLFGGAGFLVGAALGAVFATSGNRLIAVLLGGVLAAVAVFAAGYLTAPTHPPAPGSCECTYTLGRYWEAGFFVALLGLNVFGWWLGALVGAGIRRVAQRSDRTRPSAA